MFENFPLYWPEGRKRSKHRQRSRFNCGFGQAVREVVAELARLGATHQVVSSNVPVRRDGLPLASAKRVDDPGVAVYFRHKGQQMVFACDRWDKAEDNIWAIAKTIAAMRGIERWGSGDMTDTAFSGFRALPPPSDQNRAPWRDILGCGPNESLESAEIRYREQARKAHPDFGGSHDKMSALNAAIEDARRELGASI